ncbi:MAG TPA: GTPase [Gaiellaceae bacterium]|nr:GTPase [Gaiellaceae bacterium]
MTGLDDRVRALADTVELAEERLDEDAVAGARAVVAKAGARLGFGLELTVAALAGPTGAGKSSLFNALAGEELAEVGRRRPTTGTARAAIWGDGADPLLDWLDVSRRHRVPSGGLDDFVLLDLPDFDSVERAHRLEVDRLVALVDVVVWVVDPQKYADAAWHEQYVRELAAYGDVMAVALNQADLLTERELDACVRDLRRLLKEDGVDGVTVVTTSARGDVGVRDLRDLLERRAAARTASAERLAVDVEEAVATLRALVGHGKPAGVQKRDRRLLVAALGDAAGVPTVVRAVDAAHRRRGSLRAGWPFVRWVKRLRPDPLRRLRLPETPQPSTRTSLPGPTAVQRARVDTAVRGVADNASAGLPHPWPALVREAATRNEDRVADRLDRAVASGDLRTRPPRWWSLAAFLQRALALVAVVGAVWLLALFALDYLRLDFDLFAPEVRDVPLPTALLLGGAVAGIVLALVARLINGFGARRRARAVQGELARQVDAVADELVVAPVEAELDAHRRLAEALGRAGSRRGSRKDEGRLASPLVSN